MSALESKIHMTKRNAIAVKNRIDGETMCKYWTRSNKQAHPRDLIYVLKKCNPGPSESQYENDSVKMAELGRNYHNNLQTQYREVPEETREEKIKKVLDAVNVCATDAQSEELGKTIEYKEMIKALKKSNNSSAPGPDGIPYEFWKSMNGQFVNDSKQNQSGGSQRNTCDLIELLCLMCEDIQWHGIIDESSFSEGWMCPIYKKNEKTDIANYRPITCLNTDYKLFTKALTNRLAIIITDLIHPSQAGFIPGRSITEQTKLICMMIHYAEAKEENGLIVALDQEKAYDKIDHEYLWRMLEKFGIPESFIGTVKSLYKIAETCIMINGILSTPWRITRGVRQGDPLSCLLFDLAIEPLAASLRASDLKGYSISGQAEKLIANLFADDTTTFLSADDDLGSLNEILDDWCIASRANFNSTKTEIIPIGTPDFQEEVLRERRTKPGGTRIPDYIHIVEDGTAIRILGAWFGNLIDLSAPWTNVLEKIDKSLANWDKSNLTLEGRRLIAQMVIAGMTQYLTQVQGMPAHIEKLVMRRANKFMWGGKSSLVNEQTMFRPIDKGGQALVDIKTRNKAISVIWLKSYLKFGQDQPLWAYVADALMATNAPKSEENYNGRIKISPFLQTWKTKTSNRGEICPDITNLFKTAREFDVQPEGLAFTRDTLRGMPIWYHHAAAPKLRRLNHSKIAECLKSNHEIRSVGDAEGLSIVLENASHIESDECVCSSCMELENEMGCQHPHSCASRLKGMLDTLPEKWDPRVPHPDDSRTITGTQERERDLSSSMTFKTRLALDGTIADIFRIFTSGSIHNNLYK